jgi:hypothetical protein
MEPSRKRLIFALLGVLVIILILVGELFYYFKLKEERKTAEEKQAVELFKEELLKEKLTEEELPIGLDLLKNPIVYEWRGSVEGTLIEKDEHSFVLRDTAGNSITITDITPSGEIFKTIFYKLTAEGSAESSLKEIPIGTKLRGEFWIMQGGKSTPVGGSFEIVE